MAIQQKILKNIVILFIFFSFVKLETESIKIENGHFEKKCEGYLKLGILGIKGSGDSYLKITVEGGSINNVISYYQKENLSERKQLAQSLRKKTVMWLNSQQIKNDFFITVECAEKECSYDLFLDITEEAELNLNEQYTYYVTQENQKMKFKLLKEHTSNLGNDPHVSVWVKGNKEIQTELKGEQKQSKDYSYYDIEFNDYDKDTYYLTINGKIGDLINVGLIFYYKCYKDHCYSDFKLENGEEITSFIKPASSEIFDISTPGEINIGYYYDINNKFLSGTMVTSGILGMNTADDSLFYTMQYIIDTNYDGQGNNKYSPLLDGIYNIKQINQDTTIGLIPMKPKDDFKYLTYEVFPIAGDISVSIYECDNYPLCHLNDLDKTKLKKIDNYQSYYYSYNNDDLKNISPISKNQKMLLITCEEGLMLNYLDGRHICSSSINMKTDNKVINNTAFNYAFPPYQRFIRKDNVDKYFLKGTSNPIHLYIEKFAGDIKININQKNEEIRDNFYVVEANKDTEITITGKKNSIYAINDNYYESEEFAFHVGFYYLIKLEKEKRVVLKPMEKLDNLFKELNYNYEYFFKIFTNCDIKVDSYKANRHIDDIELKPNIIYQNKLYLNEKYFTITGVKEDNCLLYISSYNIKETISSEYSNGITLGDNIPQTFIFNSVNNEIVLSFPHIELEKKVTIQFKQLDNKKYEYNYDIKVNETYLERGAKFNVKKKNFEIEPKKIKDVCNSENMCKILIRVESEDKSIESRLKITMTNDVIKETNDNDLFPPQNKDDDDDDDDDGDKKVLIIILSIIGVLIVIGVGIALFYYCKIYSKNKDLSNAVNQISFKDDDKNKEDDEVGDSLLD